MDKLTQKSKEIKGFKIEDFALIAFLCSRVTTWLFTTLIGTKGIYLSILFILLLYLAVVIKKIKNKEIDLLLIFFIVFFVLTFLIFISAAGDRFRAEWLFGFQYGVIVKIFDPRKGIFALFLVLMVRNKKQILNDFQVASYILFVYLVFQVGLFLYSGSWINYFSVRDASLDLKNYNLQMGYEFILCFVIFEDMYLRNKRISSKVLSLFSVFFAIYIGARGVLIVIAAFYFLNFFFNSNRQRKKRVIISLAGSVIFVVIGTLLFSQLEEHIFLSLNNGDVDLVYKETISQTVESGTPTTERETVSQTIESGTPTTERETVSQTIESRTPTTERETVSQTVESGTPTAETKIGSRTVDAIISGNIADPNGRLKLWSYSIEAIKDSPIFGHGLYGDRPYVGNTFRWGYSHNIVLEMMASFGVFGLAFCLLILFLVLKYLTKKDFKEDRSLLIIIVSICCKLFISDSFLYLDMFWMLIGLFILIRTSSVQLTLKKLGTVLLSLIIINVLVIVNYVNVEVSRQINRSYVPEKQTAVIMFEGTNDTDYTLAYKLLKEKGITGTSFISGGLVGTENKLSSEMILEMSKNGWDFQDNFYQEDSLLKMNKSEVIENIKSTNELFEKLNLEEPNVAAAYYGTRNDRFTEEIIQNRNIIVLKTNSISKASYKRLSPKDLMKLNTYTPSVNEKNWNVFVENFQQTVSDTVKNNGVLFFEFRKIQDKNLTDPNNIEYVEYILNYLQKEGFQFMTMDELAQQTKLLDEEKTIQTYWDNWDLKDYFN